MDILNRQDCTILKSEWFNMLADNWIHNKTGWNKQSTRQKKLKEVRVTSNHIKAHHITCITLSRHFHFAVLPGLVRFSFPNLGRCEATPILACECHVFLCECHVNVYDVCFFRFFGTSHCGQFGHFESIPQYNHEASPGSRLRSWGRVMKENAFGAKLDLNWLNCIASKCDLRCVRGVEKTQTSWLIWSFKMFVRALHNIS